MLGERFAILRVTEACAWFGVTFAVNVCVRFTAPCEVVELADERAGETGNEVVVRLRSMILRIDSWDAARRSLVAGMTGEDGREKSWSEGTSSVVWRMLKGGIPNEESDLRAYFEEEVEERLDCTGGG